MLRLTFLTKLSILIVQILGFFLSGSAALLGDSGHLAVDMLASAVGWRKMRGSQQASTRDEQVDIESGGSKIVGGLIFLSGIGVLTYALSTFGPRHEVKGWWMLGFAMAGLIVNAWNIWSLTPHSHVHLVGDVREHEFWDFMSSVAVTVAGAFIAVTRLVWLDTAVATIIGGTMIWRGVAIVWRSHHTLR